MLKGLCCAPGKAIGDAFSQHFVEISATVRAAPELDAQLAPDGKQLTRARRTSKAHAVEKHQPFALASDREQDLGAQHTRFYQKSARRETSLVRVQRGERPAAVVVAMPTLESGRKRLALGEDRIDGIDGIDSNLRCYTRR